MRNLIVTILILVALVCLVYVARAAPPTGATCPGPDQLGGTLSAAGIAPQAVTGHGQSSFTFQATASAGSGTINIVACCTGNCDLSTGNWSPLNATPLALAVATPVIYQVSWPSACLYSVQVATVSGLTGAAYVACGTTAGGG